MLYLRKQDYDLIVKYCRQRLPEEACGLLGGTKDGGDCHVEKVYFLTNMEHGREHFFMDPKEQFTAIKDMRAHDFVLLGNFHSHPNSPSCPSKEDIRLANDMGLRYLILSLMGQEPELTVFRVEEGGQIWEEPLISDG